MSIPSTSETPDAGTRETRLEENSAILAAFGFPPIPRKKSLKQCLW
jgi:hypothetical protein